MKIKGYFTALKELEINYYRVIHSIKTALACFIGLGIEKYYDWPSGHWVPITIMVVMSAQKHFGGAVYKASMRFLGTLVGGIISVAILWFFGDNAVMIFCTVFFASVIFSYVASSHGDISYAGTLGGVTVLVILTSNHVGMEIAVQRGLSIGVGIVIALLVSRFIFPIHARDRFRYHVATTLRNLRKLYFLAIQLPEDPKQREGRHNRAMKLNLKVAEDIVNQPKLIHEAVVGSRDFAANRYSFDTILSGEHSLNRLIHLMHINLREAAATTINVEKQVDTLARLHEVIGNELTYLADCFENITLPETEIDFTSGLAEITHAVEEMPKLKGAQQLIMGHSFLFFTEQIIKELENMRELIVKVNGKNRDSVV